MTRSFHSFGSERFWGSRRWGERGERSKNQKRPLRQTVQNLNAERGKKKKKEEKIQILYYIQQERWLKTENAEPPPARPGCGAWALPRHRVLSWPGSVGAGRGGILLRKQVVGEGRPASVGAPAVAVVGGLVGLGFLGDGAALAALPGAALWGGREGEAGGQRGGAGTAVSGVPAPPAAQGGAGGPQALWPWASVPRHSLTRLSPEQAPRGHRHQGTGCLLRQAAAWWPSCRLLPQQPQHRTLPPLRAFFQVSAVPGPQAARARPPRQGGGRVGAGGVCRCARVCVCAHTD